MSFFRHITAAMISFCITVLLIWTMMMMISVKQESADFDTKINAIFVSEVDETGEVQEEPRPQLPELEMEPVPDLEPEVRKSVEEPVEVKDVKPEIDLAETSKVKVKKVKKPRKKRKKKKKVGARKTARARFVNKIISRAPPIYPQAARRNRVQGYVVVSYSVLPSGAVANVRVISSNPPGVFNSSALKAVRRWRYVPQNQAKHGLRQRIRFVLR